MAEQRDVPRVFISYSHDTVAHQGRVLDLADRLRADGIDAEIDQYNDAPPEGWPCWCERQIEVADVVLMVCTETYHRRVRGEEAPGKGMGVVWESRIIRQLLYDAGAVSSKFVPALFSDGSPEHIPTPVKGWSRYVVDSGDGYESLYRRLTKQPRLSKPALGPLLSLPARPRRWTGNTIPDGEGGAGLAEPERRRRRPADDAENNAPPPQNEARPMQQERPRDDRPNDFAEAKGGTMLDKQSRRSLGVDVGTTKIAAGIIELREGKPEFLKPKLSLLHKTLDHDSAKKAQLLDKIKELIDEVLRDADASSQDLDSIGIGMPGQVCASDGRLLFAPGLDLRGLNIQEGLQRRYHRPIFVDNDVNCATLAELLYGRGRDLDNFICVFVGTGIGGGVVLNKRLIRGRNFAAGEIGHMKVDFSDSAHRCTCHSKGCLEEYASARAMIRAGQDVILDYHGGRNKSLLGTYESEALTCENIASVCAREDMWAQEIARRTARYLGLGLSNAITLLDPDAIFIGGGIVEGFGHFDWFVGEREKTMQESLLNPHCRPTPVYNATYGADSPIIGAASLVYYERQSLPG